MRMHRLDRHGVSPPASTIAFSRCADCARLRFGSAAHGERARSRRSRAAEVAEVIFPALPGRGSRSGSATSAAHAACSRSCSSRCRNSASTPCSTACAIQDGLQLGWLREPDLPIDPNRIAQRLALRGHKGRACACTWAGRCRRPDRRLVGRFGACAADHALFVGSGPKNMVISCLRPMTRASSVASAVDQMSTASNLDRPEMRPDDFREQFPVGLGEPGRELPGIVRCRGSGSRARPREVRHGFPEDVPDERLLRKLINERQSVGQQLRLAEDQSGYRDRRRRRDVDACATSHQRPDQRHDVKDDEK